MLIVIFLSARKKEVKKETGLGLTYKKHESFGEWYSEKDHIEGFAPEIGVMVMVHGDDKGLVLPPKVASVQVIVIPVPFKDANTDAIFSACSSTVQALREAGFRAEADLRDNYSPGWKYSHWEMKGVPLRIEIGPKDLANNQVNKELKYLGQSI
ncbi:hypothetical protein BHE74_00024066 [Ensete ventricosum]|uniref:proline--tRNA ligase n=1 Tax=Ensete ventricosum TaxID=4639 RepID=A0A426ZN61_ENSVE|nr:hypothetical protein B296_00041112 [Ensete ventricosum]RWW68419.1 hypothetical protein BHE74_00024066 [Ensete ventricosum]